VKVWLNGAVVDEADARLSVLDHGVTVGDGAFETLRVYAGRPFSVDRHLERLAASAAGLGLPPISMESVRAGIAAVVSANELGDAALRVTLTSGPGPTGSARGEGPPTIVVSSSAAPDWAPTSSVWVAPWPRNERGAMVGIKTTSYAENVVALAWSRERGGDEALLVNLAGNLCEGTGSNLFVVVNDRLLTPPLSAGCLAGVTRALILEASVGAEEADLSRADLAGATEAFLTSSTRHVHPIATVDGHPLTAAPGPHTTEAAVAFAALRRAARESPNW